jgi:hypothetical protein
VVPNVGDVLVVAAVTLGPAFFNEPVSGGPDTCETNAQRVTRRGCRRDGRLRLLATVNVELVCYAYGRRHRRLRSCSKGTRSRNRRSPLASQKPAFGEGCLSGHDSWPGTSTGCAPRWVTASSTTTAFGTYLGVTYANLFPQRVGALVVDGNIDPVALSTGSGDGTTVPFSTRLRSDLGAQATLEEFFRLGDAGTCAFEPDSAARYAALVDKLKTQPLL